MTEPIDKTVYFFLHPPLWESGYLCLFYFMVGNESQQSCCWTKRGIYILLIIIIILKTQVLFTYKYFKAKACPNNSTQWINILYRKHIKWMADPAGYMAPVRFPSQKLLKPDAAFLSLTGLSFAYLKTERSASDSFLPVFVTLNPSIPPRVNSVKGLIYLKRQGSSRSLP